MKLKVEIIKILKICSGHFHCWCHSNIGIIRKPNNAISDSLWRTFLGEKPTKKEMIEIKTMAEKIVKKKPKLKWYQKFHKFIKPNEK